MPNLQTLFYPSGETPKPEINSEALRIYGHMLCPMSQRAFLSFAAKDIPFQKCHMDLISKAQWHVDFNGGFVPLLESPDGTMVNDSAIIMNFAAEKEIGKGLKLWPHEHAPGDIEANMKTAQMRLKMQEFDKLFAKFWGPYMSRF